MKQNNKNIYKSVFLFFLFTVFLFFRVQAQGKDIQVDSTQVVESAISIENISGESEKLSQRIIKLREILKPSAEIKEVDSLLKIVFIEANSKKDSLLKKINNLTRRDLKVSKIEWKNYHSEVKIAQKTLKNRTEAVSEINDEIVLELIKWKKTKEKLISTSDSKEVYNSLDLVINTLNEISQITHKRLDNIYIIQKELTELILIIDETITEIELVELQMQKDYFVFDSEPIWKYKDIETSVLDTTVVESTSVSKLFLDGIKKNKQQIREFLSLNMKTAIFQLLFILTLFVLMLSVYKKWEKNIKELTAPIEIQAKIVLSNPISATIVLGLLVSAFFYDARIPAFAELHVLLILFGTVILLPKLTNKQFSLFLILIFFVYLIYIFEAYLDSKSTMYRWILIIDAAILIIALVLGRRIIKKSPKQFESIYQIFKILAPFYVLILVIAVFANISGMVNLSKLLIKGILMSTALGMVVYLSVKIITSLFVLFFKIRSSYNIKSLSAVVSVTRQRIQPILIWIGLFIWLIFTLNGFDVFGLITSWINDLMLVKWDIGKMTISLGGILSFFGIFITALILAKLTASIFLDEWMVNVLPRGVAPAISLLLRIVLVGIGLYMALAAAGIDLSKLGWILGALGVGIGFGLQNIVLNFISGLILAFERPINLGDTIEIDKELGVVTSIGIRSSNIKSYSGYEAIIPNGDLISKKVINYTLSNRDRRSKIIMKTAPNANPEKVIALLNEMASEDPRTRINPAPKTYFYGYDDEGNLSFALFYWTTFSDTLETDNTIALNIFAKLKEEGILSPAPVRRIINEKE